MYKFNSNNEIRDLVLELQKNQVEMMSVLQYLKKEVSLISEREKKMENRLRMNSAINEQKRGRLMASVIEETFGGSSGSSSSSDEESTKNENNTFQGDKQRDIARRPTLYQSQLIKDAFSVEELTNIESDLEHAVEPDYLTKSFQSFVLLTVEDDESFRGCIQSLGESKLSPFIASKGQVCDRFPRDAVGNTFCNDSLASFCTPMGVTMRILPRCALGRAKELGWMGRKADKYAEHSFQDEKGNRTYGISLTVKDEVDASQHYINIESLQLKRQTRVLVKKIIGFWRKFKARRSITTKSLWHSLTTEITSKEEKTEEQYRKTLALASESYKTMIENYKLGDVLIVEKCYVLLGTQPDNHSLLFSGLHNLIKHEDEMRQVDDIPLTDIEARLQRCGILEEISEMALSPEEAKISYPQSELEHTLMKKQTYETSSIILDTMQLPLPLPQIGGEYGVAKLIMKIGLSDLLFLLEMLLLERSVLVTGECSGEVTSITFTLLALLKPYQWQSSFMPTLTEDMMDFISSPVPFIAGMIARNSKDLEKIIMDSRVQEAMDFGLTVINLSSNKVYWTKEKEVRLSLFRHCKSARNCWFLDKIDNYQQRMEQLAKNEASSLHSFEEFFQKGLSVKESVVVNSINLSIQDYLANFSGTLAKTEYGFKMYGAKDRITGEKYFSASRFSKPANHLMEYQKHFSQTQILACFYEHQKNSYHDNFNEQNRHYGVLIANWIYFKWTLYKQKSAANNQNFAVSCVISATIKRGTITDKESIMEKSLHDSMIGH